MPSPLGYAFAQMRLLAVVVLGVSTAIFAAEPEPEAPSSAQALSDADRVFDSAMRTGDDTKEPGRRRAAIARDWFADQLEVVEQLNGQERLVRLIQLIKEAHARSLDDVIDTLETKVVRDLAPIRSQVEADALAGGELAALGRIHGVLEGLPRNSAPWKFFDPVFDALRSTWTRRRDDAKGPGEAHAWNVMLQFLDGSATVAVPGVLEQTRFAAAPKFTSECPDVKPTFISHGSLPVTPQLTLSKCVSAMTEGSEARSGTWIEKVTVQEMQTVLENVTRTVESPGSTTCTRTTDFNTGTEKGARVATSTMKETCGTSTQTTEVTEQVERRKLVNVVKDVERTESYVAKVRSWRTNAEAEVTIAGDGLTLTRRRTLDGVGGDAEYSTQHVGSRKFNDATAQREMREGLSPALVDLVTKTEEEWTRARGEALAASATSLDERVRAAVLLQSFDDGLSAPVSKALSLPPTMLPALLGRRVDLELLRLPQPPELTLPPPSADLEASLTRYENRVLRADGMNGAYMGPFLGIGTQETLDQSGLARFGVTGGYTIAWQPMFSVKSPFLLRVGGDIQLGWLGYFQMNVSPRLEVGVRLGPIQIAAVGMTELGFGVGGSDAEAVYRWPLFVAAGYGGRFQFKVGWFGMEVVVTRMHRTWPGSPLALRGEGRVFIEVADQARFFLGMTLLTTDDGTRGLSTPTRFFSSVIGLHQTF